MKRLLILCILVAGTLMTNGVSTVSQHSQIENNLVTFTILSEEKDTGALH